MSGKKLEFLDPLASRVLAVDASVRVTVAVKGQTVGDGGSTIGFSVDQPSDVARVQKTGGVENGQATTNLVIVDKPPSDYNAVLLSAWDTGAADADHYTIMYVCTYVDFMSSWNVSFVSPYGASQADAPDHAAILDLQVIDDDDQPVPNYRLYFSGSPNLPTWVADRNNKRLSIENGLAYVDTDSAGTAIVKIANTAPTIAQFNILYRGANVKSNFFTFTNLGSPDLNPTLGAPELPDSLIPFDLDHYDGEYIPITIPPDAKLLDAQRLAVWINGIIARVVTIGKNGIQPVPIPKRAFKNQGATNQLGYMAQDLAGNSLGESSLISFPAVGTMPWVKPGQRGNLPEPQLQTPGQVVNTSLILGGLKLVVPPYPGMRTNDLVVMTIYLNGYFPGTRARKVCTYQGGISVKGDETRDGVIIAFPEADLGNYGPSSSTQDDPPLFYAQYSVTPTSGPGGGSLVWSDWLELGLDTVRVS